MKVNFTEWLISIVLMILGVVFIIIGISVMMSSVEFKKTAVQNTAIISNIESSRDSEGDLDYDVSVNYVVKGEIYTSKLNFYSSDMVAGKEIEIYYDPASPENIRSGRDIAFEWVIPIFGSVIFVIGFIFAVMKLRKKDLEKKLLESGRRIDATVEEIEFNTSYSVYHKNPYVINCKWADSATDETYLIRSESIWYDPKPIIESEKLTTVPVYMDMNNPKEYYVSVGELTDKAEDLR